MAIVTYMFIQMKNTKILKTKYNKSIRVYIDRKYNNESKYNEKLKTQINQMNIFANLFFSL